MSKKCSVQYEVQVQYAEDDPPFWSPVWVTFDSLPVNHPQYRETEHDGWVGDMRGSFDDEATAMYVFEKYKTENDNHVQRNYRVVRINTRELISDEEMH